MAIVVIILVAIGGFFLMVIGGYSIGGYSWLFYWWLFVAKSIDGYSWLFVVKSIDGYWWLFYW